MRLQSIELREFRNHREARFDLCGDSALVTGENASGKTNLIEAVVLLSIGRSFRGARDPAMARRGADLFEVRGRVESRLGVTSEIVTRGGTGPKEVFVDGSPLDRITDLLGRFCTVHFSVEDVAVLNGGPASRRRFLDVALCQLESAYVGALREYTAALKQRNRLLLADRHGPSADPGEWSAWEEILARAGVALDRRRRTLCAEMDRNLRELSKQVDKALDPTLEYRDGFADSGASEEEEVTSRFEDLERARSRDRRMGWTMHGPHRARLSCGIGGEELAEGASRGYSRLYSILLRLALARVFEERQNDPPVVLLDDPESELDPRWIGRVLKLVPESSQVLVTACRELSETPARFRRLPIDLAALAWSAP
ncbi:MAG: DNA replication and repair protein RecF [Candidatus Eisenbacteria bacterium]|uniref:DNA replication and repair protein RecF n=1 Tax=Eiseniibacteriota bacterium TaxID=2212470 RepID=A0A538T6J6_UNCEI|nr:MAG: DNA replication and repair protein RecF [Candidatus Eisenbacteria bacterium]